MKIAILSRKATLYSTSRLIEACRQRGADVAVIDPLQCVVKVSKKRPEVFHNGERVDGVDGVVPRIGASITFYGLAVLRQFEMMGVFPANESQAISRSRDKLRSLQLLTRYDIGIPPTVFARRREDVRSAIQQGRGCPRHPQAPRGDAGHGRHSGRVGHIGRVGASKPWLGWSRTSSSRPSSRRRNGTDYRAIVVGRKVVAAMARQAGEGEFRSNLHRGGTAVGAELEPRPTV